MKKIYILLHHNKRFIVGVYESFVMMYFYGVNLIEDYDVYNFIM